MFISLLKKGRKSMNKNMRKMYTEEEIKDVINYAIEKGLINNAKPVYWHSVSIKRLAGSEPEVLYYYFDFIIINNDATPFTLDSFKEFINLHPDMVVKTVQGYVNQFPSNLVSSIKKGTADNTIDVTTIKLDTGSTQTATGYTLSGTLTDIGVNKIN